MMGFSSVPLDNKCCENATTSMSWQSSRLMKEPRRTSSTFCANCNIGGARRGEGDLDALNGDECRDPWKVCVASRIDAFVHKMRERFTIKKAWTERLWCKQQTEATQTEADGSWQEESPCLEEFLRSAIPRKEITDLT